MVQLVYTSAAREPFTPEALKLLLAKARDRNAVYEVTGMLLYHAGSFLQILEGPRASVDRILASIERDPRHMHSEVIYRSAIGVREFENWSMGFIDTSRWPQPVPGMVDYYRDLPEITSAPSAAKRYLRFFHQGLCRAKSA